MVELMNQTFFNNIASIIFGLLFTFIGFSNAYWGNDPYFGIIIIGLSFFLLFAASRYFKKIFFSQGFLCSKNSYWLFNSLGKFRSWGASRQSNYDVELISISEYYRYLK